MRRRRRLITVAVALLPGCFPVRPDTPTAGSGPVPRRTLNVRADEPPPLPPPAPLPVSADSTPEAIDLLHTTAVDKFAGMHSYVARLRAANRPAAMPSPKR